MIQNLLNFPSTIAKENFTTECVNEPDYMDDSNDGDKVADADNAISNLLHVHTASSTDTEIRPVTTLFFRGWAD